MPTVGDDPVDVGALPFAPILLARVHVVALPRALQTGYYAYSTLGQEASRLLSIPD